MTSSQGDAHSNRYRCNACDRDGSTENFVYFDSNTRLEVGISSSIAAVRNCYFGLCVVRSDRSENGC